MHRRAAGGLCCPEAGPARPHLPPPGPQPAPRSGIQAAPPPTSRSQGLSRRETDRCAPLPKVTGPLENASHLLEAAADSTRGQGALTEKSDDFPAPSPGPPRLPPSPCSGAWAQWAPGRHTAVPGGRHSWVHWSFGKDPPPRPAACRAQTQERAPGTGPRGVRPARGWEPQDAGVQPLAPVPTMLCTGVSLTENSLEAWPQATALGQSWSLETTGFTVSPSFCRSCCPEMAAFGPQGLCSGHLFRSLPSSVPPQTPAALPPPRQRARPLFSFRS